jgi:NAD(P)-dependent dehydrogenase (short-subunit alcohol dehydrogenase family)
MSLELDGRRILVTGASGSIGRATAVKLAEAGAHVILNGRDMAKLEETAALLPKSQTQIEAFDLNNGDAIPGWMLKLCENDRPLAGIAHTAGIYSMRPLRMTDASFVDNILNVNVASGIMLGKALRQKICHTEGASYVLVSSVSSRICGAGNVSYAASKGAVVAAAKAMAHELIRDKIRVNCVVPATVESEMAERVRKTTPAEYWDAMTSRHPMGLGQPSDIANAICYLLSDATRWMIGTELLIDGGMSVA